MPELQGRFPIIAKLHPLTEQDFYRILNETKNSLIEQYKALVKTEDVTITFEQEALKEIAAIAYKRNEIQENIGARRLATVMRTLLNDLLYKIPDEIPPNSTINIDLAWVKKSLLSSVK